MHPFGAAYNPAFNTMATGKQFTPFGPYDGLPGGLLGQMGAGYFGGQFAEQYGMSPMGLNTYRNLFDRIRHKNLTEANERVLAAASTQSAEHFYKTMRGTVAGTNATGMTHVDLNNPEVEKSMRAVSENVAKFSPILAQVAPEVLDSIYGLRGSQEAMSTQLFMGGQHRFDPVTGRKMTADEAIRTSDILFNNLYAGDNFHQMKGIKAGEAGQLYGEMVRRGMAPGPAVGLELTHAALQYASQTNQSGMATALNRIGLDANADISRLSDVQVEALSNAPELQIGKIMNDSNFRADFNASKIQDKLREYSGAISAMQEIFGDAGTPGTIAEILNALDQFTNGTLNQLKPQQVEASLRQMKTLAGHSGVGMEGAMLMMDKSSQMATALGLHGSFAQSITSHALAYRTGINSLGINDNALWGQANADQLMFKDQQLTAQAANSDAAYSLALVMRAAESVGVNNLSPEAKALVSTLQSGRPDKAIVGEALQKFGESPDAVIDWLQQNSNGTLSGNTLATMLADKKSLQKQVSTYELHGTVRAMQWDTEVAGDLGIGASMTMEELDTESAISLGKKVMQELAGAREKGIDLSDDITRREYIAKILEPEYEKAGALKGMSPEQRRAFLMGEAESTWSSANLHAQDVYGEELATLLALQSPDITRMASGRAYAAKHQATFDSALAGINKGSIGARFFEKLHNIDPNDKSAVTKALLELTGHENQLTEQQAAPLLAAITQYQKDIESLSSRPEYTHRMEKATELRNKANAAVTHEERSKLLDEAARLEGEASDWLSQQGEEIKGAANKAIEEMDKAGIRLPESVNKTIEQNQPTQPLEVQFPQNTRWTIEGKVELVDSKNASLGGDVTPANAAPNAGAASV